MELAMAPRVLPSLPQSRHLIAKPILRSAPASRARIGLVRSSSSSGSGSDFWSRVNSGVETARLAVAEKEDEARLGKDEEVKEEVSSVEEVKEEVSSVEEEKDEVSSVDEEKEEVPEVAEVVSSEEVSSVEEVKEEVSSVEDEKNEVSSVDEEKEEVPEVAEVKEVVSSEEVSEEQSPTSDLLNQLNLNLDSEDKPKLLVYGAGALVALWISSAVVSAVDSIPLFPKLMEVVGLGYTVWFSSRYLLFKDNREELFSKIVELKEQVLGSDDE